ncbi:MAG: hypothetical protein PHF44_02555 [Candidatus Pacebacteria bacterium]|nr:hypothetical protein [Candidatus Paceibacterota bacterium]
MRNKIIFILLALVLFLPRCILADAPPPPPFLVNFTYEGQKIADEKFYAVILECDEGKNQIAVPIPQLNINQPNLDGNCNWLPYLLPYNSICESSQCNFRWILGSFKIAVYIPSLDKTFVSDAITREYLGHYGSKTQTVYDVNISKDDSVVVIENNNNGGNSIFAEEFLLPILAAFLLTFISEAVVLLIFVLVKKLPKITFLALLIGNLLSVPFVWFVNIKLIFPYLLLITEIVAIVFEAWLLKIFGKKMLSWKLVLLISFLMNAGSFFVGYCLIYSSNLLK